MSNSKSLAAASERLVNLLLDIAKPCQQAAEAVRRTAALPYEPAAARKLAGAINALADQLQPGHDELVVSFNAVAESIASVKKALKESR
jgi:hypothetical protein